MTLGFDLPQLPNGQYARTKSPMSSFTDRAVSIFDRLKGTSFWKSSKIFQ
jgi:hypothetical protein